MATGGGRWRGHDGGSANAIWANSMECVGGWFRALHFKTFMDALRGVAKRRRRDAHG